MKKDYTPIVSLLMAALFGLMLIPAIVGGGSVYKEISVQSAVSFNRRTACGYISTQVRNAQQKSEIYTDKSFGDTINIPITLDGEEYITKIYCHEGYLFELFTYADAEVYPEDGEQLLPLGEMTAEMTDGLLCVTLDGEIIYLEVGR